MRSLLLVPVVLAALMNASWGQTQDASHIRPLFARPGAGVLTVTTGIPYVAAVEYAIGITPRLTAGVVGGFLPEGVTVYGVRLQGLLYEEQSGFRLFARLPVLYYPPSPAVFCNREWLITLPSIQAEWQNVNGTRYSLSAGLVSAACLHNLLGHHMEEGTTMNGNWNTIGGGIVVPMTSSMNFRAELSAVLEGTRLAGPDWVARFPVILVVGVSTSLNDED